MAIEVDSIGQGIAAFTRARTAMARLAEAEIPMFGAARREATQLRSEAVEQGRLATSLLHPHVPGIDTVFGQRLLTPIEQASMRAKRIRPVVRPALEYLVERPRLSLTTGAIADVRTAAQASPAWRDPAALRSELTAALASPVDTLLERDVRLLRLSTLLQSPATRELAPALPASWVHTSGPAGIDVLALDAHQLGHSSSVGTMVERIAHHVVGGSFASADTQLAAARTAAAASDELTPAALADLAAILGDDALRETMRGAVWHLPWADAKRAMPADSAATLETLRLVLTGAADDTAHLDAQVEPLIARIAGGMQLDVREWAQLRSRLFDLGGYERLGFDQLDDVSYYKPERVRALTGILASNDERLARDMHGPVRETFVELLDSLYLRRIDDAALRAEVRPLMDAPGATQLYKLRQRMALHGGAERLGLTTHIDGATQMDLALGSAPSYATPYLERWKLQLDGIAGNPARIDAAARELLEQGPSLDRAGRVRLRVLLDEHGAAARLGVSTAADLSDDRALRLWREQLAGRAATPEQAAALARTLLDQAAPLTDEQLHVLGTAVFDAGAAEALGLRTTIRQLGDASARFSGDSTANAHHQQRFANLWRAQLAGTPADPAATRAALQAVDRSGHEIGTVDRDAMLQVMLHGVDLPDAQGTATAVRDAITWPTRSGVAPLERMQQVFASPGSSGHSDIARHARIVLDRLDLPAAQADAELAQLREVLTAATRDGFEMLDDTQRETMLLSAFDHGLGPRLKLPPLPSDVTPARLFDPRFASRWRAQALLEASGMPHADRAAQLQQLATEGSGAAVDPAEFNALVQSTDSAALPAAFDAARRQRIASLLVDSGSLDPLADVHLDRARQLAADAFMPPAPPASRDEAIARMSQQLSIDAADPIARSRAHHELFDRGLLDAAVPDLPSTQRVAIEQLLEQSRTATSTVQEKLAYWKLQLDPRAAPAQFADLERAVAAGEPINAAELSRLHTILERAGQPVASARMRALLAAAQVEDISQATAWLPEAVRALDDPGAAAALRQTHDGIFELALLNMQRTLDQHPEGYLRSFANHPDYAEVGRVQSAIKLLTKLAPDHPAIDVAAQPAAVSADAAGTLVW